jgi:hypothetical protein
LLIKKDKISEWPLLEQYTDYDLYLPHDQEKWNQMQSPELVCSYCPESMNEKNQEKTDSRSKIIISTATTD